MLRSNPHRAPLGPQRVRRGRLPVTTNLEMDGKHKEIQCFFNATLSAYVP